MKETGKRAFLGVLYLLAPFLMASATAAPIEVPVMTQNLYLGADPDAVLANPTPANIAAAFQSVQVNDFVNRANAIAGEAAAAGGPLLIGLQEAEIIGFPGGSLDYASILRNALQVHGLSYTVAGVHTGFMLSSGQFSVTDQEVVLARSGVPGFTVTGAEAHTFVNDTILPTALGPLPLMRGYVLVDATLNGVPFEFVSTHLDETHTVSPLEAGEILARLSTDNEPQLVVGDFNSRPTEAAYAEMLAAGFVDVAAALGASGPTCCQSPTLDNPVSQLDRTYDYIFERGFSSLDFALLVGNNTPFENVRPLWPSDHAGLIAAVDLPEPAVTMVLIVGIFFVAARSSTRP